jgi:hypothetical protein
MIEIGPILGETLATIAWAIACGFILWALFRGK